MRTLYAGVDLGGTKTAVLLSETPPVALARREFPTLAAEGPQRALDRIQKTLENLLAQHGRTVGDLAAIGVSCGNPLDRRRGIIQAPPNLPTWVDVPIRAILEEAFHIVCHVENDANAGAVAEHRFGAGRGARNMVFLTLGTGLGAGIILDGALYRGATDDAGEIGHIRLTSRGPMGYHKAGSVEGWSSGGGMAQLARSMLAQAPQHGPTSCLSGRLAPGQSLTARDVGLAALAGDALALRVVTTSGKRLGQAMAILIDLLNPECIVLGSLALRLGEALLAPMRKVVEREALPRAAKACAIVPAALGERIGDVAAICVAMGLGEENRSH